MENLCYHPWVGLDITPQGEFRPCCKYQRMVAKDINEYLSSEELSNLKQEFTEGKRPSGCASCWRDEDAGLPSKRQIDNQYVFNNTAPNLDSLKVLSLPFGNTCNLACRTCNSVASSRWSQEEKKLKKHYPNIQIHQHQKFYKDVTLLTKIKELSTELIDLTVPGGESFITGIPQQLEFLDYLIANNANDITLTYITNTTTFPDNEFWSRWVHFKKVNIQLSVDGTGSKFEYLRWPANWNECYLNIKQYQAKQAELSNLQLSISYTVSIFNVFDIPEFVIWCLKEKLPMPYFGMVSYPDYYSIKNLPQELKEVVTDKLNATKFMSIVNYMNNSVDSNELYLHAIERTKVLDAMRGQDFNLVFPYLQQAEIRI